MKFATSFFVLVSLVISGVQATVPAIEADIAALIAQAKALDNTINSFPVKGGTLAQAVPIRNDSDKLAKLLDVALGDAKATPAFNEADATRMYNSIKVVSPIIIHGLEALIVRKPGFDNLGVSPLVLKDVQNLGASAAKFADAMITKDPATIKPSAIALKATVDAKVADTVAAYSK